MTEVLVEFETIVTGPNKQRYIPHACGRSLGTVWDGWIEFAPVDPDVDPVRTPRETVQPNRADLLYWAEGLTQIFLEGALARALGEPVRVKAAPVDRRPLFDTPLNDSAGERPGG